DSPTAGAPPVSRVPFRRQVSEIRAVCANLFAPVRIRAGGTGRLVSLPRPAKVISFGEVLMVDNSALEKFRAIVRGAVLCPGQDGYDAARTIPNAMIDRRPAIIARCTGAADVIACVRFAREHDLLVSIRGGGHSVAGKSVCDGGLMVDLTTMKGIRVDPAR